MSNLLKRSDGVVRQLVRQPVRLLNMIHADLMRFAGVSSSKPVAKRRSAQAGSDASGRGLFSGRYGKNTLAANEIAARARSQNGARLNNIRGAAAPDDECIYAVGDVHGQEVLLDRLLGMIEEDAGALPDHLHPVLVFLGDYVDRGLGSRKVIETLTGERLQKFTTVFIAGNHEDALLRFHGDASVGEEWVAYGGRETLVSYGVQPPPPGAGDQAWIETWRAFRDALPENHLQFLKELEHSHIRGDYLFVHAGLRPGVPLWQQSTHDMMWIRNQFLNDKTLFPKLVVHGHTPTNIPEMDERRLGLDTGAYSTGILTAARLCGRDATLIST